MESPRGVYFAVIPPPDDIESRVFYFVRLVAAAAGGGGAAKGVGEGVDKDKIGGGLLVGKKRARLMPEQPFEKVTPEAGEEYAASFLRLRLGCRWRPLPEVRESFVPPNTAVRLAGPWPQPRNMYVAA